MARQKISFVVDEKGRKQAVVLPIKECQQLLDDLADLALMAEGKDEPTKSLEAVKQRLEGHRRDIYR
ncbi:MAG: hypothetical protein EXR54_08840 [Dehalococcoidia bacterium]|nr:hypothetical protein [Dehalococcoidia bacterium]MSQ17647.1 hypothetical protein [Dehalococcoidia bacterium]